MRQVYEIASGKSRLRTLFLSPAFAWLLIAAVAVVILFKVALPLFVSTASVRTNMERALSSWSGATARIAGEPDISFWPHPVLTLHAVTFEGDETDARPLATADSIKAGFDLFAALRGKPVFYNFHLLNPTFKIERRPDGSLNWARAGWIAQAIESASLPVPSASTLPIGDIEIENGTFEVTDQATAAVYLVTDVSGTVHWPSPANELSANLSGRANGEKIEWSLTCDAPMMLLSGRASAIRTSFSAAPLSFAFQGTLDTSAHALASGQLQLTVNGVPALMDWLNGTVRSSMTAPVVAIDTTVSLSADTIKMDNLTLSLDGANATGVLDIARHGQGEPKIDGTLAFEQVDLASLVNPFLASGPGLTDVGGLSLTQLLQAARLDLRLSARQARYGPVVLDDIAAGIMVEDGRASLDIGDASYSGGALTGRATLAQGGLGGGTLQVSLKNADLSPVAESLALTGPLPLGTGTLRLDLATRRSVFALTPEEIFGELRYTASNGVLTHFNAAEFERLTGLGGFFNINQASDGDFAFSTAEITATLRNGVAELTTADIRGEDRNLSVAGRLAYRDMSLAFVGALQPYDRAAPPARFFAGGAWPNAIISPLSTLPAQN